jgi:hypothetical protein
MPRLSEWPNGPTTVRVGSHIRLRDRPTRQSKPLSTDRLPGEAGQRRTVRTQATYPGRPSPFTTDYADTRAPHGTITTGFLNRVRKFDSCRGHATCERSALPSSRSSRSDARIVKPKRECKRFYAPLAIGRKPKPSAIGKGGLLCAREGSVSALSAPE